MAFCTNCGSQVPDGTKFCPGCGQKIGGSEPATPMTPVQVPPVQPVKMEEPKQAEAPVQGAYQAAYTPPVAQQSYTPPTQQSYTPPTQQSAPQQSYTPPAQQSYQTTNAPQGAYTQQGGYQPQGNPQQSYSAQPAYAPTAQASKQKKPMNKKTLFIIGGAVLAVILAVVLISVLGGKGGKNADYLGVYMPVSATQNGETMNPNDVFGASASIELLEGGKCVFTSDMGAEECTYKLSGKKFSMESTFYDLEGKLEDGVLTIEDVYFIGVDIVFERSSSPAPGTGMNTGDTAGGASGASASELQKQWNGTWYGCLYVSEATGAFADIPSDFYDAYMVVDVDASGKGQFAVFLDGVEDAFALANCEAKESGLYAIDGTIAGGEEMYAYNWMFLPMPDYPDQYVMGDVIENGDNIFDYKLFMKQWGGSWQKEIDSDFAIVPPSVEWYGGAIERGEVPPVGFAPIGYAGTAALSGAEGNSGVEPGEVPDDQMEPQPLTDGEYGSSEAAADGIVPLDTLKTMCKYCDEHRGEVTYNAVYSMVGNVHGVAQVERDAWKPGEVHQYGWFAESGEYVFINFHVADDGQEYWSSMSNTSGLKN